ncbi:MAG TPA: SMC-Scp complex subunit ScpB [Patescibacteria group bacterium]|nr:SMC-Scp complex subunit ScpB [Patescibacteria group bacterium]
MSLKSQIESLLFIAAKPLSLNDLNKILTKDKKAIKKALIELRDIYHQNESGLQIIEQSKKYQMVSSADNAKLVQKYLEDETSGELSQPSLEALTIIAYRGPISKTELERIRGVNCSLIIRNLLLRGLIEEKNSASGEDKIYNVSLDFIRFLGIESIEQLPDYERLNKDQTISDFLAGTLNSDSSEDNRVKVSDDKIND